MAKGRAPRFAFDERLPDELIPLAQADAATPGSIALRDPRIGADGSALFFEPRFPVVRFPTCVSKRHDLKVILVASIDQNEWEMI